MAFDAASDATLDEILDATLNAILDATSASLMFGWHKYPHLHTIHRGAIFVFGTRTCV